MKQEQRDAQIKTILLISVLTCILMTLSFIMADYNNETNHIYNITVNQNNTIIQNKSDDCLTTCEDIFRKVGCSTCHGVQPQGQDWFYYPDDCIKYCEKKNER